MLLKTEKDLLSFGEELGKTLTPPALIELVGDVGSGKTTLTKGIAKGLGLAENITSPSFTISKRYSLKNNASLNHYDFYRLPDPGLMSDELSESILDKNTITIIEWADSVSSFLPPGHIKITLKINDDSSRTLDLEQTK